MLQIGTEHWLTELGINTDSLQEDQPAWEVGGKTVISIAIDGQLEGIMGMYC